MDTQELVVNENKCNATVNGRPCKMRPVKGRRFCAKHGGLTAIGPDTGPFKHGLASINRKRFATIGSELLSRIEDYREDPELFSLRDDAAYMTALIDRRAEAAASGFGVEVFKELRGLYSAASKAYRASDTESFDTAFKKMGEIFAQGGDEAKSTDEVVDLIGKRVQLVEAEQRVAHAKAYTLEVDQAYSLVMQVVGIVKQSVRNADELTAIKNGVARLLKVYQQDIDNTVIDAEIVDETT
jgi:hypothetical protein